MINPSMINEVQQFLKDRRKAELQTIHQFWFPGEPTGTTRETLESRLSEALLRGDHLEDKLARLSRTQRAMLGAVLCEPKFVYDCRELSLRLKAEGILTFEVESAARMLQERGFLLRSRLAQGGRGAAGREFYQVPRELGERLGGVLDAARKRVEPALQLSQRRLSFEIDFDRQDLEARIGALPEEALQRLAWLAVDNRGVCDRSTPGFEELTREYRGGLPAAWKDAIEEAGVGTLGAISLKDFGIHIEEPALVVFQEWVQRRARATLSLGAEPDTLIEAGVDLYVDLDRVALRIEGRPLALTRGKRLSKRVVESLRSSLYLPRIEEHLEGDMTEAVVQLTLRLGILESYADLVQVHAQRLRHWRKLDLTKQVQIILKVFLEESQGGRWSFHQETLRRILIEFLKSERPTDWLSLDSLVSVVVSTYLLELEEREVRESLRQRREEDFARERLSSPFHRLGTDLVYWIVHRFLPLGVCELGTTAGRLTAFRLTPLGMELFGIERAPSTSRILVNPDFEIILFREGLRGMRLELALSRFGERISAERIRRFRMTRESLRDGIRSGLSVAEIREILESASEHPLPAPVLVALGDWGKDHDWVLVAPAMQLRGLKPGRARVLSEFLASAGFAHQVCGNGTIVIDGDGRGEEWSTLLERLRGGGWLVREEPAEFDLKGFTSRN